MKQPKLTMEQYDMMFDCVSARILELQQARKDYEDFGVTQEALKFIDRKIYKLNEIAEIIGPYTI